MGLLRHAGFSGDSASIAVAARPGNHICGSVLSWERGCCRVKSCCAAPVAQRVVPLGIWCNWQHNGFWYRHSRFESWYPSQVTPRSLRPGSFSFVAREGACLDWVAPWVSWRRISMAGTCAYGLVAVGVVSGIDAGANHRHQSHAPRGQAGKRCCSGGDPGQRFWWVFWAKREPTDLVPCSLVSGTAVVRLLLSPLGSGSGASMRLLQLPIIGIEFGGSDRSSTCNAASDLRF